MTKINFNIPVQIDSSNITNAKLYFLKEHTMPLDKNGDDVYTFQELVSIVVTEYLRNEVRQGKSRINAETSDAGDIFE